MLYICIPAYNEAETVGVLLWRIRKVFQEYSREYEILVYDDGSTDATAETLKPYGDVLPLTVLGGKQHLGYARALDALCRAVSARTRYPRRDAMITLQADFTDQPEHLPELIKRFEGGADLVVAERNFSPATPAPVRRLRWIASLAMRASKSIPGVADPFGALRLYRISLIRDLAQGVGRRADRAGPGLGRQSRAAAARRPARAPHGNRVARSAVRRARPRDACPSLGRRARALPPRKRQPRQPSSTFDDPRVQRTCSSPRS